MTTMAQWISGARPRTLANPVSSVLVGSGAAIGVGGFAPLRAVLALVVAVVLVVGANFANDYFDGVRGTDSDRVGPFRLVGAGAAEPETVRLVAFGCFGLGALAGLVLVALSGHWWMLLIGAGCLAAAWFYTGGKHPYAYSGFGELAVFICFGPIGVLGTMYVQTDQITGSAIGGAVAVGAFSAAVMVTNNLRDIPTDQQTNKRTLAVLIGEQDTRNLYLGLIIVPFLITIVGGFRNSLALLGFFALPVLIPSCYKVLKGTTGKALIPVLRDTALAMLVWALTTAIALAIGG